MSISLNDLTFATAIRLNDLNKVFAIHCGGNYLVSLDPVLARELEPEIFKHICWFQLDIKTHKESVKNILGCPDNFDFHLITLATFIKQEIFSET